MRWIRSELDRIIEDFGVPNQSFVKLAPLIIGPLPAMKLTDGEKEYRLPAELPGFVAGDVKLEVTDAVLTISEEQKDEGERKDASNLLTERSYSKLMRPISLFIGVDSSAITAKAENGVLQARLGKDEMAEPPARKIEIEA